MLPDVLSSATGRRCWDLMCRLIEAASAVLSNANAASLVQQGVPKKNVLPWITSERLHEQVKAERRRCNIQTSKAVHPPSIPGQIHCAAWLKTTSPQPDHSSK
eukprot:scaffold8357_cov296-Pinguiococcus_pyrenoidosus.AAC.5